MYSTAFLRGSGTGLDIASSAVSAWPNATLRSEDWTERGTDLREAARDGRRPLFIPPCRSRHDSRCEKNTRGEQDGSADREHSFDNGHVRFVAGPEFAAAGERARYTHREHLSTHPSIQQGRKEETRNHIASPHTCTTNHRSDPSACYALLCLARPLYSTY
jgi:hypothetical protein